MREVERFFDLPKSEFEAGIERELVFMSRGRGGKVYNFNVSPEVYELLNDPNFEDERFKVLQRRGWRIEKEYSKTLIEIVSPPKKAGQFSDLIGGIIYIRNLLDRLVPQLVRERYPYLSEFSFFTQSRGTSVTSEYLSPEGSITSDETDILNHVLDHFVDFVKRLEGFKMQISGFTETNVGIYNHLNSTHLTFHPEYSQDRVINSERYFRLLTRLSEMILFFKPFDRGNRQILREGKIYEADENIRDLFLVELNRHLYGNLVDSEYRTRGASVAAEIDNLEEYAEKLRLFHGKAILGLDELFGSWNSLNFRPRFIDGHLPAIEIRAFGSSISLSKIRYLVQLLANL